MFRGPTLAARPVSQSYGGFHDYRPGDRFGAKVCHVVLTLDSAHLEPV